MRSGTLRSAHMVVAVVLAAPAPAHAISDDHAASEGHPRVGMRVTEFGPDHATTEPGSSASHVLLTAHDTVQPTLATLGALRRSHRHDAPGSLYSALALGARRDPGLHHRSADAEKAAGANRLPAKHKLDGNDTANWLSKHYYGSSGGALTILWSIGLKKWRPRTKIVKSTRYKIGDTILIPKPPKASINPPSRDAAPTLALRATSGRLLDSGVPACSGRAPSARVQRPPDARIDGTEQA